MEHQKTFFIILFFALLVLGFFIVLPFLTALLTASVLAYIFYPLYRKILDLVRSKNLAAFLCMILVILIVTIPLFFILNTVSEDAYTTYLTARQRFSAINTLAGDCQPVESATCQLISWVAELITNPQLKYYVDTTIEGATTKVTSGISGFLFSIPVFLIQTFVAIFIMFFLFRDGTILLEKVMKLLPVKEKHRNRIEQKLNNMTFAVVYGSIVIAVIQGTLGGIGFFFLGLNSPILWGVVMAFAALIPFVGTGLVWVPFSLWLMLNGYVDPSSGLLIKGVILFAYGALIVGMIDNLLRPKIVGDKGGLHPVLVLLGVFGGLQLLGFIGVLIGPILIALFVAVIDIYEEETNHVAV